VLEAFLDILSGRFELPKWGFARWIAIADLYRQRRCDLTITAEWIPSHGKGENWIPRTPIATAAQARALNQTADNHATKHAKATEVSRALTSHQLRVASAISWSAAALRRLVDNHRAYLQAAPSTRMLVERWHTSFSHLTSGGDVGR